MSASDSKISICANAKINLCLDIVGKLPNGYHEIKTVMQTLTLCDTVTLEFTHEPAAEKILIEINSDRLDVSDIPTNDSNTCCKAAKLFFERIQRLDKTARERCEDIFVKITVKKQIPQAAGLGGGSSDAAAVLKGLNSFFGSPLDKAALCEAALQVGADVPFFIDGGTALCCGIGEKITPLPPISKYHVLLIKPHVGMSTPEAYKRFDELNEHSAYMHDAYSCSAVVDAIQSDKDLCGLLSNDFECVVTGVADEILEIKDALKCLGADDALMTGSGSCVFGLFKDGEKCAAAYSKIKDKYAFAAVCKTT